MHCNTNQPTTDHLGYEVGLVKGVVAYLKEGVLVNVAQFCIFDLGVCIEKPQLLEFPLELIL